MLAALAFLGRWRHDILIVGLIAAGVVGGLWALHHFEATQQRIGALADANKAAAATVAALRQQQQANDRAVARVIAQQQTVASVKSAIRQRVAAAPVRRACGVPAPIEAALAGIKAAQTK